MRKCIPELQLAALTIIAIACGYVAIVVAG